MSATSPLVDPRTQRRQKVRNAAQSLVLLAAMVGALALLAWLLLGPGGVLWVVAVGALVLVMRPKVPVGWVLSMYGARRLPPQAVPGLHEVVAELSRRARLPRPPALYYVATPITNAFALGRPDDAALAVTDGLLRRLSGREVIAVLAHEISHIRAGDTTVMTLSDTIGRLVHGLSYAGMITILFTAPLTLRGDLRPLLVSVVLIALPTAVTLLQLALSRSREYDADLDAVALTGDPEGLASALQALERNDGRAWERTMVPHGRMPDPLLLRTHPSTEDRVRRLRQLTPSTRRLHRTEPFLPDGYTEATHQPRLRRPGVRW